MLVLPLHALNLTANEGGDARSIVLSADNTELVAYIEDGILVRTVEIAVVLDAGHHEVTARKTLDFQQLLAVDGLVAHLQIERMRLLAGVFQSFKVFLLIFGMYLEQLFDEQDGTDDADNTQRVSAGITQGNGVARIAQLVQGFLCGTQTRGVGNSTVEHTNHHRQFDGTIHIEYSQSNDNV